MKTTLKNYKEVIAGKDFYKGGYTAFDLEKIEEFFNPENVAKMQEMNDLYTFKKMMSKQLVYTPKNDTNDQIFEPFGNGDKYYIIEKQGYKILVHEYSPENKALKVVIEN